MHKSCAELPIKIQIDDDFHPHPLTLTSTAEFILCNGCGILKPCHYVYKCMECATFNLDFKCAAAWAILDHHGDDDETKKYLSSRPGPSNITVIDHFSHPHQLTHCELFLSLYNMGWPTKCMACIQDLHARAYRRDLHAGRYATFVYVCLSCKYIIHESCLVDMPKKLPTPFHPQHILRPWPLPRNKRLYCYVCHRSVKGIGFGCNGCNVVLHVSCATYQTRAINHNSHPHRLLHLGMSISIQNPYCCSCNRHFNDSGFFGCVQCRFFIHAECLQLQPNIQHAYHLQHPLVLVNSFAEDDSGQYYCDICETERNHEHHVYCCRECTFVAHIDCVLPELKENMLLPQHLQLLEGDSSDEEEIGDKMDNKTSKWKRRVHNEKIHPHPLTLYDDDQWTIFVCEGCEELDKGIRYRCTRCHFNLHVKCVDLIIDNKLVTVREREIIKSTKYHFCHPHQLTRCKIRYGDEEEELVCKACRRKGVRGVQIMYVCLPCNDFFIHEYCLEDMPMQVENSPFHPQHPLRPMSTTNTNIRNCDTCHAPIKGMITFACLGCNMLMHYSCAKYQTREIKHNSCHPHPLLHLGKTIFPEGSPSCNACKRDCGNTLFSCVECGFYIHLECIPLPRQVKHRRHLHPLTLTNSVVEDDSGNYYCDVCETERNPEHDIYYCEECTFIAHIQCVTSSEVEPPDEQVI